MARSFCHMKESEMDKLYYRFTHNKKYSADNLHPYSIPEIALEYRESILAVRGLLNSARRPWSFNDVKMRSTKYLPRVPRRRTAVKNVTPPRVGRKAVDKERKFFICRALLSLSSPPSDLSGPKERREAEEEEDEEVDCLSVARERGPCADWGGHGVFEQPGG